MKDKIGYSILSLLLGVFITVCVFMGGKVLALKQELNKQNEYITTQTKEKEFNEKDFKDMTKINENIRNEFHNAEKSINNRRTIDNRIKNIEKKIKEYDKKEYNKEVITKAEKREMINRYFKSLDDLKEVNTKVSKGEHIKQSIIDDIHDNLMVSQIIEFGKSEETKSSKSAN